MRQILYILIGAFVIVPTLLLSYQVGTPKYMAASAYFNSPALTFNNSKKQTIPVVIKIVPERNLEIPDIETDATSMLIWDFKEDFNYYSKNAEEPRPIASLTKLITAAIVLDYVDPQETTSVSAKAIRNEGNSGNLKEGEVLTIKDLLAAALLESSNDAAYALAEHVGGKLQTNPEAKANASPVREFVRMMNLKFNDLGLLHSNFIDPAGLEDIDSFTTANDFSKFIKYLRENPKYVLIWNILKMQNYNTKSLNAIAIHNFKSTNPFLGEYPNIIGGKTGFTNRALGNMVLVTTSSNNTEIIYLVLGSNDRFSQIRKAIKWVEEAWSWPNNTQQ
ncbi:MAG: serine hydrolase [bacterium]|nr:serine hydrolase [bacterium]